MECVSFKFKTRFTYQKIVEWIWLHLPQCDFISIDILRLLCYTNKKKEDESSLIHFSLQVKPIIEGNQIRNLETEAKTETIKECCFPIFLY